MSYDPNKDYAAAIARYIAYGDYANAALAEQSRNEKITGEGMTQYEKTYDYAAYLPGGEKYTPASDDLLRAYVQQPAFSYDPASDPLYQQYKSLYLQGGRLAMEDTMGQAAGLTGGYGSSYAQSVGQQSFNSYLQQLNAVLPELYAQHRQDYDNDSELLYNRYLAAQKQEQGRGDEAYQQWSMDNKEHEQDRDTAFALWGELGYANDYVAAVLGIPVGTETSDELYRRWQMDNAEK